MDDTTTTGGNEREAREAELADALGSAFRAGELSVAYQPLVGSSDAEVIGAEALLRWDRSGVDPMSPSTFVPIAERAGLMEEIGGWVLETACEQLAAWQRDDVGRDLILHVNLSATELLAPGLPEAVGAALSDSGVGPVQLCLEVTDSAIREGGSRADAALHELETLGVRLCLCNFGSPPSIDALTRYRFDYAKVDRELAGGLGSPGHRARLVRGLLGMARALGTTLIAERIERGDELDRIAALGVVKIQGYATGRPMSGTELGRVLAGDRSWSFAAVG
jgi:EAL domain-containing protein (putative c-di-GMP-specific phosphodiesterase class I)